MTPVAFRVLVSFDQGMTPVEIAATLGLPVGTVYAVLRQWRPNRLRAPRRRTSQKRALVMALHAAGFAASRIAVLLKCSRARVYKILQERSSP